MRGQGMDMRRVLRERLSTPSGQMTLIGATIAAGAALAVIVATQRPWFEKHVREKYAAPQQRVADVVKAIDSADDTAGVLALSAQDRRLAYEAWMQGPDGFHTAAPAAMARADAPLYIARAWQTLICGSPEQRMLAVRFLEATGHADATGVLRRALDRARARGEEDMPPRLEQAILALTEGGPR